MSLDLSKDYLVIDDPQDILYSVKIAENQDNKGGVKVSYTQWEMLTQKDYKTSPSLLQKTTRAVNLWRIPLNGITPKMEDQITDKFKKVWFIEEVEHCDLDANGVQRYRCLCSAQLV